MSSRSPDIHLVTEPRARQALAHPERRRIVELLVEEARTARQLAEALGGTPGRVHYHVKALEKAGLIEIASRVERGGVVEKYYRPVARNVCVADGIGEYGDLGGDLRTALSARVLDWRRAAVLDVDVRRVAGCIVRDCLLTSPGDVLLIHGSPAFRDIMVTLHQAIDDAGAHGILTYRGRAPSDFLTRFTGDAHAAILFEEPQGGPVAGLSLSADADAAARARSVDALARRALEQSHVSVPGDHRLLSHFMRAGVRTIHLAYPTEARAEQLGIDFRDLHDAFWLALDVDYTELEAVCRDAATRIRSAREVHLRSAEGTDLRFTLDGGAVRVDDGIISDAEVAERRGINHLPAGKLLTRVVGGSAQGTLHCDVTECLGTPIRGVRLRFRDGVVESATAEENEDLLHRLLEIGDGDHDALGVLELGMNPRIGAPVGHAAWDQKARGRATIGIGRNDYVDGSNVSNFSWNLQADVCCITLDGHELVDAGGTYA